MNTLFHTASRLAKIRLTEKEMSEVKTHFRSLASDVEQQEAFFAYCRKWKLAPWLHTQMERHDLSQQLSEKTRADFASVHQQVQLANERRNAEAVQFLSKFREKNIDVAILKGNLFAHTIYHDSGYKRMNDFDILIHADDWGKAQEVYAELRYIPMGFGWSGEKQKAAKFSHTGIPFISRNFYCITGTQWGLKSPTTHYRVDLEEAWRTAKPFDFFGVPVKQLSPEYNLLHLILHMGIYKCGIRDCMDVYNLLLAEPMEEDRLRELFAKTRCTDKALFTLQMSRSCSDVPAESLIKKLEGASTFVTRRLKSRERCIEETGDLQSSYHDYFQDVEKNVLYFNIVHQFHQKAVFYGKLLRQIWWPEKEIALKFIDKAHRPTFANRLQARLRAPGFVFALIAQEIGWPVTFLLYTKLFFDTIFSLVNYVIPKENYFDFLAKQGIDPKQIKKAVADVQ